MPELQILYKEMTLSTMDDARSAVRHGAGDWTVCRAGCQTGGRGRIPGRVWEDSGKSLLFTLILDTRRIRSAYPLTQVLALALCRYLEKNYGLKPAVKWPNDVMLDGRKLAGILVEIENGFYLAGIGLNVLQTGFSGELRRRATSLGMALTEAGSDRRPSPDTEFLPLLNEIDAVLHRIPELDEISRRLYGIGQEYTVSLGDPARNDEVTGRISGLSEDGALLLEKPDGELFSVYSGEICEIS